MRANEVLQLVRLVYLGVRFRRDYSCSYTAFILPDGEARPKRQRTSRASPDPAVSPTASAAHEQSVDESQLQVA